MNLDQADIVDTPDLNGKAVEDSTDSREDGCVLF
jgi:hypothetical protein